MKITGYSKDFEGENSAIVGIQLCD